MNYQQNGTLATASQQLQKVAFDGLLEDKIVFTMDKVPDICKDDPTCYGLLDVECYCSNDIGTPTKSFNFLHLGIQEYFAAKYVATLPEGEMPKLLKVSLLATCKYSADRDSKRLCLSTIQQQTCCDMLSNA